MNYGQSCNPCDNCCQQGANMYPYACCAYVEPDRLYPADTTRAGNRRLTKCLATRPPKKSCASFVKVANLRKKTNLPHASSATNICKSSNVTMKPKPAVHPSGCGCANCDFAPKASNVPQSIKNCDSNKALQTKRSQGNISAKESCAMSNASAQKSLKNYMFDNQDLKETNYKKSCVDEDDFGSDTDVWIVQCPTGYDPNKMINSQMGKLANVECSVSRFAEKKTLAIIAPEKAAEYQLVCDKLKLVKPVGKIVVSEKFGGDNCSISSRKSALEKKASVSKVPQKSTSAKRPPSDSECSPSEDSMEDCDSEDVASNARSANASSCNESDEVERKPLGTKKMQKQVEDQKFTIETTVTVEKIGDRKKGKCLPFVPAEPSPIKGKKKKSNKSDELNWMDC